MAIDFTKWSVDQMRNELVKLTGMSISEVNAIKGKSILAERIMETRIKLGLDEADSETLAFDRTELDTPDYLAGDAGNGSGEEEIAAPILGTSEWQDYVLSILTQDEYEEKQGKKFPKVNGLRRVAQLLLGPITFSAPTQVFPAVKSGDNCTVVYTLNILWAYGSNFRAWMPEKELRAMLGDVRVFAEVADVNENNTPEPYVYHAAATASSRAESRALRKALQLNILTAEEMSGQELASSRKTPKVASLDETNMEKELLTSAQLTFLSTTSDRLDIDLAKALQFHGYPNDVKILNRAQASQMSATLNKYQTNSDSSLEIPNVIKKVQEQS